MSQSSGPRFNGPIQTRQRIRLAAALGMLAITAISVGGLASLVRSRAEPRAAAEPASPGWTSGWPPRATPGAGQTDPVQLLDHNARLEHQVREAEEAVTRARAAITSARQLGSVDPALLSEFERRLGLLGDSPLDAVRRSYGPPPEPVDQQGRPHVRAIASHPRQL